MNKYKIKKVDVVPKVSNEELYSYQKCYVGISMNNDFFWDDQKLEALLKWSQSHFNKTLIVVGDYIHRLNGQIFQNLSEEESIRDSLKQGETFIDHLKSILQKVPGSSISYVRWQELYQELDAICVKSRLLKFMETDTKFKRSLNQSATEYVKRKLDSGHELSTTFEKAVNLSSIYIIEEISCFSELVGKGWKVELYPGEQLKLLDEINKGKFSKDIPLNLKKRIFVQLRVRTRSQFR